MAAKLLPHLDKIRIPAKDDKIYKDECAYSFDTPVSHAPIAAGQ
jgi:Variant UBP zinc finger